MKKRAIEANENTITLERNTTMNIIKTVSSVALALAAPTASADLIYWQIQSATGNQYAGEKANQNIEFDYATISANGSRLYMYNDEGVKTESRILASLESDRTSTEAIYAGTFSDPVSSFLVELWESGGTRVGWQSYSASELANNIGFATAEHFMNLFKERFGISPSEYRQRYRK